MHKIVSGLNHRVCNVFPLLLERYDFFKARWNPARYPKQGESETKFFRGATQLAIALVTERTSFLDNNEPGQQLQGALHIACNRRISKGCGCGGQHRPYERSFLFRLDADRHRRDFVIVRGSFGSRAVGAEAEMAEAEIVLPKPAAVLVPPFRSCKPAASDGGTRCRVLLSAMHFRM